MSNINVHENSITPAFTIDDSKAESLAKRILTIRDHWGIHTALKIYPYVDKVSLSKYEYC